MKVRTVKTGEKLQNKNNVVSEERVVYRDNNKDVDDVDQNLF